MGTDHSSSPSMSHVTFILTPIRAIRKGQVSHSHTSRPMPITPPPSVAQIIDHCLLNHLRVCPAVYLVWLY